MTEYENGWLAPVLLNAAASCAAHVNGLHDAQHPITEYDDETLAAAIVKLKRRLHIIEGELARRKQLGENDDG